MTHRFVVVALVCMLLSAFLASCGDDSGSGIDNGCTNCQYWTELTTAQAQFGVVHPTRPEVIAFSSRRADTLSISEDLWIRVEVVGGAPEYFRITDDPGNERLPAWSPDGKRLSFSRFGGGRYDLWIVDVTDFESPTDLRKITSSGGLDDEPSRSYWRDNNTIVYSNGVDIIEVDLISGMATELVPDPADEILGLGVFFEESQVNGVRDEMGNDRMVFVSKGRGPQGSISVLAFAETGEEVNANIAIDQKPLLTPPPNSDTLVTPFLVQGIAPGEYVVSVNVNVGPDDFCDTTLFKPVRIGPNQVIPVEFAFERPRGAIRVVGPPTDGSTRLIVYRLVGNALDDPLPIGSVDKETTFVDCLWPGTYVVQLERAEEDIDADTVEVCERRLSQVCVTASQFGCLEGDGTVACIDTLVYSPPPPPGKLAGASEVPSGPVMLAPVQEEQQSDLWVFDFAADSLSRLTEDADVEQFPTWSPDGRYVAYLVDHDRNGDGLPDGEKSLLIMNYASRGIRSVPLPGRPTTRICNRTGLHPAWMPSGRELVISLTNCDDEVETNEVTHLWVADVSSFLPP